MSRPASDPAGDLVIRRLEWEPDAQLSSRTWAYTATWKGRPVAIQAIIFRPDRSALFLTPDFQRSAEEIGVSRLTVLKAFAVQVDRDLQSLDVCFLQAVTEPDDAQGAEALRLNQFRSITEVREMQLSLSTPVDGSRASSAATFDLIAPPLTDPRWRAAFADSTRDQLDVPELLVLRTTDESFESLCLLAKGDTDHWRLAVRNDEPIGLILPTPIPDGSWEIQYVGVTDKCRRQGIGRSLLTWGIETARTAGATTLSAQVDARNDPAFALYCSLGFDWQTTRTLWLRPANSGASPT
jgi:ribosomal protein S18 acetylase RimI-like enzyme